MKVIVTGDIGSFKSGQTITAEADVATYLRTVLNEGKPKPSDLTDAQILAVVDTVPGFDDGGGNEWEGKVLDKLEAGDIPSAEGSNVPPAVAAANPEAIAANEAALADDDEELQGLLVKTGETVAFLSCAAYFMRERLVAKFTAEKLLTYPRPGTTSEKTIKDKDGNVIPNPDYSDNPDWYERPTRRKGGALGSAWDSWVDHWCNGFKSVRIWLDEIKSIDERLAQKEIGESTHEQLVQVVNTKISAAKAKLRAALELHHQWEKAKEYPTIEFKWDTTAEPIAARDKNGNVITDKDGNTIWETETEGKNKGRIKYRHEFVQSAKPIIGVNKSKPTEGWSYSIQEFINLDFDEAMKKGGTIKALADTRKRQPAPPVTVKVETREDSLTAVNALASYFNESAKYLDAVKYLEPDTAETREVLLALSILHSKIGGLLAPHMRRIELAELEMEKKLKAVSPNESGKAAA